MVWFYRDPVKDYYKVTDFEVRSWRPGLRESYARSMAAAAVAETLLASHGGGSAWGEALSLAGGTLDVLEGAGEEAVRRVAIRFFWNWGDVLGLRPGTARCAACGRNLEGGETAWYSRREGQLFCTPCADPERPGEAAGFLPVSAGTRRWLRAVESLPPAEPGSYTLDRILEKEAASLTQEILAAALGRRLSTWNW
jgi:DNA repair protein RecO (recombination protein O)